VKARPSDPLVYVCILWCYYIIFLIKFNKTLSKLIFFSFIFLKEKEFHQKKFIFFVRNLNNKKICFLVEKKILEFHLLLLNKLNSESSCLGLQLK